MSALFADYLFEVANYRDDDTGGSWTLPRLLRHVGVAARGADESLEDACKRAVRAASDEDMAGLAELIRYESQAVERGDRDQRDADDLAWVRGCMVKVSSTRLARYIGCPRKARLATDLGEAPASQAMAYGTVFHACVEFYAERGRWPARSDLWKMTGNYSDPRDAVRAYPELWDNVRRYFDYEPVEAMARADFEGSAIAEKPLADYGLTLAGGRVLATGFFDVLDVENQTIRDWKTRSSFRYAPITAEDFHDNVQLAYYAAALAQVYPDWDYVIVQHRNVLRPREQATDRLDHAVYEARIDRWYLDRVWEHLDTVVAPAYYEAMTRPDIEALAARPEACYMYGTPCPYMATCRGLDPPENLLTSTSLLTLLGDDQ